MKYRIEKNTVQETLILPLYSRKLCTELYPNLYRDETAVRLIDQIDYDFSVAEKNSRSLMQRFGALEVAMRQNDLAFEVQEYLKTHPCAAVVNLGCGLDNTGRACDNGRCKIYNLDFPDVIALRQQLLPAGEREQNIPCDLKDPAWFSKIDASGGAVFFASGVFYYFLTEQVKALVQAMADAFPGSMLVFDAANRTAVKMIAKTWLKTAKIKDVGAYFAISDAAKEIGTWDSRLQVSSRGYMLGYSDLKDPSVSGFFRFLARVGDGGMKMQIVKIGFGGKVVYEPNMEDYLLCHAAFVMPAAFACYKTDGDLKKLRGDTAYLNRLLDANIEGYRAIRNAGHTILPKEDADFEGEKYRKTCLRFFKLMCATSLGKLCASDHAMNAIDEMSALNRDLKKFFDENGAAYPVWQALEAEAGRYLQ